MSEEDAFIYAILADPSDPALRLVYADWLEERSDAESVRRAEYLRVECQLARIIHEDGSKGLRGSLTCWRTSD
jgi:uncharacterized protein (TIGR02996 family)